MQTQRVDDVVPWEPPPAVVEYRDSTALCRWTVWLTWATVVLTVLYAGTSWWVALTPRPAGSEWSWFGTDNAADLVDGVGALLTSSVSLAATGCGSCARCSATRSSGCVGCPRPSPARSSGCEPHRTRDRLGRVSVWHRLGAVDLDEPSVVSVGTFDGVHRGHQVVLGRAAQAAWRLGGRRDGRAPVVAVTFDPHPLAVLAPDRAPELLTPLHRRIELLHETGVDHCLALTFDRRVAGWLPEEFIARVLVDTLHAGVVVVGVDFRFGARAAGTVDTLHTEGERHGFAVEAVEVVGDTGGVRWSSTEARAAIAAGDVAAAAQILGRDHTVEGVVVEGDHRGRELGYPTANVPASGMLAVPADGVYAGTCQRLDADDAPVWPAAISVGTNPTFDGVTRQVESYVLDRDDLELYGVPLRVAFRAHLRGQVRFDGVDALVAQMAADVERTRTDAQGLPRATRADADG